MKILKPWWFFPVFAALALFGCNSGSTTVEPETKTEPSSTTGTEPKISGPTQPQSPSTAEISADLKGAGYSYYGLDNAKFQTFSGVGAPGAEQEAGQQTTFMGMIDGVPTFKVTRTGALSKLGDSELIVKKDGLYTTSVGGQKLDKPSLEVPANLAPGMKWKSNSTFTLEIDGQKQAVTQDMAFHAVAVEKVTTKLGAFDALKVVATGTMKVGDRSGKSQFSIWFVKDVGLAKMNLSSTTNGVEQKMTMEIVSQK